MIARHWLVQPANDSIFVEIIELPDQLRTETGIEFCTSASSTAAVLGKKPATVEKLATNEKTSILFQNEDAVALPDKLMVEGSVAPITPISFKLAILYWISFAIKGDETAQMLIASIFNSPFFEPSIERMLSAASANKTSVQVDDEKESVNGQVKEGVTR